MATIFPASLPLAQPADYAVQPIDNNLRTDMESGPARVRLISSMDNDQITITWWFDDTEMGIFRDWYRDDIYNGSSWFTGLNLALGNGGLEAVEARFIGAFAATLLASNLIWRVTAKLEIR